MGIKRKHDIDALLAMEVGLPQKKVREVTNAFLSKVMAALADFEEVHLDGFGRFRLVAEKEQDRMTTLRAGYPNKKNPPKQKTMTIRIQQKFRVHFAKSEVFKRILREKYGPGGKKEKKS